jgi:hypothetical protein
MLLLLLLLLTLKVCPSSWRWRFASDPKKLFRGKGVMISGTSTGYRVLSTILRDGRGSVLRTVARGRAFLSSGGTIVSESCPFP